MYEIHCDVIMLLAQPFILRLIHATGDPTKTHNIFDEHDIKTRIYNRCSSSWLFEAATSKTTNDATDISVA